MIDSTGLFIGSHIYCSFISQLLHIALWEFLAVILTYLYVWMNKIETMNN